jgi:FkbM family methyltransferase
MTPEEVEKKLSAIHSNLRMVHGSLEDELPEQRMAVQFLTGSETILEIGGNVGRSSVVLASLLGPERESNLVVLECDPESSEKLLENRNANGMKFHIETAALSKRKVFQIAWNTFVGECPPGAKEVATLTLEELQQKYPLPFNTLVLDCEGAFFWILRDMPEVLEGIQTILVENDYPDIRQKLFVDTILETKGFCVVMSQAGGWGPSEDRFYEVWSRSPPDSQ